MSEAQRSGCPINLTLEVVGDKWSLLIIRDMIFDRVERTVRFAVGDAGVFYTTNGAVWKRLLSTAALPGHPVAAYFDRISNPSNRALYVAVNGRGILKLSPIPAP